MTARSYFSIRPALLHETIQLSFMAYFVLGLCFALPAQARIRKVSAGQAIQAVIDNAASGDTIQVAGGTYAENLLISDKSIFLSGGHNTGFTEWDPAAWPVTIQGAAGAPVVELRYNGADGSTIRGFTLRGGQRGIYTDDDLTWPAIADITIADNIIEDNGRPDVNGGGIYASGPRSRILRNIIRNNQGERGAGIAAFDTPTIEDNRVENNTAFSDHGGGMYLSGHVTVTGNTVTGNRVGEDIGYGWGGGIIVFGDTYNQGSSTGTLSKNIITGNYAATYGGGTFIDEGADITLDHELITDNTAGEGGGGIFVDEGEVRSRAVLVHCTVARNQWCGLLAAVSDVEVTNSIFWNNEGLDFVLTDATLSGSYTLTQKSRPEISHNLTSSPRFANAAAGDYHLKSMGGRYDPALQEWVKDAVHSTAIDAGDPASPFDLETAPNGGAVNLGVYGNTEQASRSSSASIGPHTVSRKMPMQSGFTHLNGAHSAPFSCRDNSGYCPAVIALYSLKGGFVSYLYNPDSFQSPLPSGSENRPIGSGKYVGRINE